MLQELPSMRNMTELISYGDNHWPRKDGFLTHNKLLDLMWAPQSARVFMLLQLTEWMPNQWPERTMANTPKWVSQEMDGDKMVQVLAITMLIWAKIAVINGYMSSQEKMYHHLPLMRNLVPNAET